MKRLSQSGSSNFCPELRKNALQSYFSNFALHMISSSKRSLSNTPPPPQRTKVCNKRPSPINAPLS